jgi:hypothetical protein
MRGQGPSDFVIPQIINLTLQIGLQRCFLVFQLVVRVPWGDTNTHQVYECLSQVLTNDKFCTVTSLLPVVSVFPATS